MMCLCSSLICDFAHLSLHIYLPGAVFLKIHIKSFLCWPQIRRDVQRSCAKQISASCQCLPSISWHLPSLKLLWLGLLGVPAQGHFQLSDLCSTLVPQLSGGCCDRAGSGSLCEVVTQFWPDKGNALARALDALSVQQERKTWLHIFFPLKVTSSSENERRVYLKLFLQIPREPAQLRGVCILKMSTKKECM